MPAPEGLLPSPGLLAGAEAHQKNLLVAALALAYMLELNGSLLVAPATRPALMTFWSKADS